MKRKTILSMQVSLDGFVEGPDGAMDWLMTDDSEMWEDLFEQLKSVDTFLLGRNMYPGYESYWTTALNDSSFPENKRRYARLAKTIPHVVFSKTMNEETIGWENTRIARGDIKEEILKLKRQEGKNIVIFGGATLASGIINLDLIDEFRLSVNPVILGGGKLLFKNVQERKRLQLVNAKLLKSGVITLTYRPET